MPPGLDASAQPTDFASQTRPALAKIAQDLELARNLAERIADPEALSGLANAEAMQQLLASRSASVVDYRNIEKTLPASVLRSAQAGTLGIATYRQALLAIVPAQLSPVLHSVYADLLLQSALAERLVAAAKSSPLESPAIAETLLRLQDHHRGSFSHIAAAALRQLGPQAAPFLWQLSQQNPSNDGEAQRQARAQHWLAHLGLDSQKSDANTKIPPALWSADLIAVVAKHGSTHFAQTIFDRIDHPEVALQNYARGHALLAAGARGDAHPELQMLQQRWKELGFKDQPAPNSKPSDRPELRLELRAELQRWVEQHPCLNCPLPSPASKNSPAQPPLVQDLRARFAHLDSQRNRGWKRKLQNAVDRGDLETIAAASEYGPAQAAWTAFADEILTLRLQAANRAETAQQHRLAAAHWARAETLAQKTGSALHREYQKRSAAALRRAHQHHPEAHATLIAISPLGSAPEPKNTSPQIPNSRAKLSGEQSGRLLFTVATLLTLLALPRVAFWSYLWVRRQKPRPV